MQLEPEILHENCGGEISISQTRAMYPLIMATCKRCQKYSMYQVEEPKRPKKFISLDTALNDFLVEKKIISTDEE